MPPLPAKFDRIYKGRDRVDPNIRHSVNLARLECSCPDFQSRRAGFAPNDARRVCEHIFEQLSQTKAESLFDPLLKLFIRYGRNMLDLRVLHDDSGTFLIGSSYPRHSMGVIAVIEGEPVVATYDLEGGHWFSNEEELHPALAALLLARMRTAFPGAL